MDDSYHHPKQSNPNQDNNDNDEVMIVSLPSPAQHQHPVVIPIRLPSTTTMNSSNDIGVTTNSDLTNVQSQQQQQQTEEWAMIEINGELYFQSSQQEPDEGQDDDDNDTSSSSFVFDRKKRVELGSLSFIPSKTSSATMIPILIIGTHQLQGTIVPLQQPFVVLHKQTPQKQTSTAVADNTASTNHHYEYEIQGIIKHKLLFNQYPKTILR